MMLKGNTSGSERLRGIFFWSENQGSALLTPPTKQKYIFVYSAKLEYS